MGIEAEEENEMKHKHYEMIVAKAANMDLTTLIKFGDEWMASAPHTVGETISFDSRYEYFLCLPQHKEVCLHWLNGGEAQYRIAIDVWTNASNNVSNAAWSSDNLLMDDQVEFRIKPKKEKRWIGVNSKTMKATHDTYKSGVECEDALNGVGEICDGHPWQFIEIEVEV